jgi:hypothetical protein
MSSEKQKQAARKNIKKAQAARRHKGGKGASVMSTAEGSAQRRAVRLPEQRKEPLNDATHVRNAIARSDQVENVSDAERDEAWTRIVRAADRFGVEVDARSWRELVNN